MRYRTSTILEDKGLFLADYQRRIDQDFRTTQAISKVGRSGVVTAGRRPCGSLMTLYKVSSSRILGSANLSAPSVARSPLFNIDYGEIVTNHCE